MLKRYKIFKLCGFRYDNHPIYGAHYLQELPGNESFKLMEDAELVLINLHNDESHSDTYTILPVFTLD